MTTSPANAAPAPPGPGSPQEATPSPTGRSLVAGKPWVMTGFQSFENEATFYAVHPASGKTLPTPFISAHPAAINAACEAAARAFGSMRRHAIAAPSPGGARDAMLGRIADTLAASEAEILRVAARETGLTRVRLRLELARTVGTFRLFADLIREGSWVRASLDLADQASKPPKPDVRSMLRPLGPVAVFGASNFPLAYGAAGGDVASALAAGCPVVVGGHPAHPGTGELLATLLSRAIAECGVDPGAYSYLHNGGAFEGDVGRALVQDPRIKAAGFTGSFAGGTVLAKLASERPLSAGGPIPVFAEMGSANPIFLLPGALEANAADIAKNLARSLVERAGQQCTCPGLIFVPPGAAGGEFVKRLYELLGNVRPAVMLSRRVRDRFVGRVAELSRTAGVEIRAGSLGQATPPEGVPGHDGPVVAPPSLLRTTYARFAADPGLAEEVFGPAALLVVCTDETEFLEAASRLPGALAGAIFAGGRDAGVAQKLAAALEGRVGRLIFNGVPTGVRACASMVQGGPFPATNRPDTTAVGPRAIERWCRPVCFQNAPDPFLPPELHAANPYKIARLVNGKRA